MTWTKSFLSRIAGGESVDDDIELIQREALDADVEAFKMQELAPKVGSSVRAYASLRELQRLMQLQGFMAWLDDDRETFVECLDDTVLIDEELKAWWSHAAQKFKGGKR